MFPNPVPVSSHELRARAEAYLQALEELQGGGKGMEDSLRRLARSLAQVWRDSGLGEWEKLAEAVAEGPPEELAEKARILGERLKEFLARAPAGEATVLVVEDDPTAALLAERFLQVAGFRVLRAQGGNEMWRLLEEHSVDVVLLDLSLPDSDGRDLLLALRGNPGTRHTPVVILSAMKAAEVKGEALALGADDYLEKPVDPALVRMVVGRAVERVLRSSTRSGTAEPACPGAFPLRPSGKDLVASWQERRKRPSGLRKVLLVEDDPVAAVLVRHRLSEDGFSVDWLTDGEAGWEAARSGRYDLVLADVKVPGVDGFELLDRIRSAEELRSLPVILLTSLGREEDVMRGFQLGADDYILKPFSPGELTVRVRRLLGTEDKV